MRWSYTARPPTARLLAELLSIRFFDWLRCSFSALSQASIDDPLEQGLGVLEEVYASSSFFHYVGVGGVF